MKIKNLLVVGLLLFFANIFAQIPLGYYDGTDGLIGADLKTKLSEIITAGHLDKGYSGLWTCYKTSDLDLYYEKNSTIVDMYSEFPNGTDYKEFIPGTNQCTSVNGPEGTCYNREHSFPKTFFGGSNQYPMYSDAHFVIPTDYWVNSKRDSFPYGEVSTYTYISKNGSKLGNSNFEGYSGTVFEPINEFKGDIARMSLYFITRYQSQLPSFYTNYNTNGLSPLDGSTHRGFQQWYINLLLKWSKQDPVSQKEIDRNNAVYSFQGNRNPYIDHPEFIEKIWTSTLSTQDVNKPILNIYPNPVKNNTLFVNGKNLDKIKRIEIYNINGIVVQVAEKPFNNKNYIQLRDLTIGVYFLKFDGNSYKFILE